MALESKRPILMNYLTQPGFSQHIIQRHEALNGALKVHIEEMYKKRLIKGNQMFRILEMLKRQFLCQELRLLTIDPILKLLESPSVQVKLPDTPTRQHHLDQYGRVLDRVVAETNAVGTQVVFLYLPEKNSIFTGKPHPYYHDVLSLVRRKNIPVIDMYPVFLSQGKPKDLFPLIGMHYSEKGYAQVGAELSDFFTGLPN